MIVDAHTHRYPNEVISDPLSFGLKYNEKHWLELMEPQNQKRLQGWVSRESMIEDMDMAGVNQSALLGWYWENQETCNSVSLLVEII